MYNNHTSSSNTLIHPPGYSKWQLYYKYCNSCSI